MTNDCNGTFTRRRVIAATGLGASMVLLRPRSLLAKEGTNVEPQPYFAAVNRAIEALARFGSPVAPGDSQNITALAHQGDRLAVDTAERILERYTLAHVAIESNRSVRVFAGGAPRFLVEQGWRVFLIRVTNPSGRADTLTLTTSGSSGLSGMYGSMTPGHMSWEQPGPVSSMAQRSFIFDTVNKAPLIAAMWLMSNLDNTQIDSGLDDTIVLSGVGIEYHVVQLFSRDHGQHAAGFLFVVSPKAGDWTTSAYGRRELDFNCLPSREVALGVIDTDGRSCIASLTIKDNLSRVYPPQMMRIAPDMAFQPQVYRGDGETVRLPDGVYRIESKRGPEYLRSIQTVAVSNSHARIDVTLKRWINPAKWGWYSGDTHIHAAGCAHYANPTEGVSPETMIRHVRGEGLSIGDILTWGPGWYFQKQFFTGHADSPAATLEHPELQTANNADLQPHATREDSESLLRYDVEVSGFPSSHAGHLVLLRLKDQNYPHARAIEDWPSWNLPILKWAKAQGAVGGYAHCGVGMGDSTSLPNYDIPPFDGIGMNEVIVDITHGLAEFVSGCEFVPAWELNAWYHMLNCGFRLAMLGETDFPCISGERPGVGRSYVRLEHRPIDDAGYDAWIGNLKKGKLYCGDGRSHFLEFTVHGVASGDADVVVQASSSVNIEGLIAAWLEPEPTPETEAIRTAPVGYHIERDRLGASRKVTLELVVNGIAVDKYAIIADGMPKRVQFKTVIMRSSWVALRILSSGHTHPVFVQVGGKPIRASRRSSQWCRRCVDKLWSVKSPLIRENERDAAASAFDHARNTYDAVLAECEAE